MKNKQPKKCERCDALLDIDGDACYQRNCNYYKKTSLAQDLAEGIAEFAINEHQGGEGSISQQMDENREMISDANDFISEDSDVVKLIEMTIDDDNSDNDSDSDSDGGEELGDGCLFGFFKIMWNIISFPFRLILRILNLFD